MPNLSAGWAHLIAGLAIIGAVSGLAAVGSINGADAVSIISGVGGVLLGSSAVAVGTSVGTSTGGGGTSGVPGA